MESLKTLIVSKDFLLGLCLFGVLFFIGQFGIEKTFIFLFVLTVLLGFTSTKIHRIFMEGLVLPILILCISIISALCYLPEAYDLLRDIVYLLMPVLAIVLGYFISIKTKHSKVIYKTLLIYCLIVSIMHCYKVIFNLEDGWDTTDIRSIGGKGSAIEAFIYALYVAYFRKKENRVFSKTFNRLFFFFATISLIIYFSRTTFIALILVLISVYRVTEIKRKKILYLLGLLGLFISFMVSLQFMDIKRDAEGIESFLYKVKMAPSEIFNSDIDINDRAQLWDRWRAYEVKKAFDTMGENPHKPFQYFFGLGAGSLVDLGFDAPLGEETLRYITHIHNGYIYIFFKSGAFGFFSMLLWLFYLYSFIYKKAASLEISLIYTSISGIGLFLFFSTLVVTGIYNAKPFIPLILGVFFGLSCKVIKNDL